MPSAPPDRSDYFRFLALPAELRNRVYDFAASDKQDERCHALPCLQLAHTCRQLRSEYLPICKQAPVTIEWNDVPKFVKTIYRDHRGFVNSESSAPSSMTIIIDGHPWAAEDGEMDILPLLQPHHAQRTFQCTFKDGRTYPNNHINHVRRFTKAHFDIIAALILHDDPQWLEDVVSVKVVCVTVTALGLDASPIVRLYLEDEEVEWRLEERYPPQLANDYYFNKTGLGEMWVRGNGEYVYRVDVEIYYERGSGWEERMRGRFLDSD